MDAPGRNLRDDRRGGFALILVLLLLMVTAAIIAATITLSANHLLVNRYHERSDRLTSVADAGLEEARAMLNGNSTLYPDTGYTVLESSVAVDDAGNPVPGVTRSLYVGPAGITSGQYGVFGMVVAVAKDAGGGVSVRRLMITQESFAKFAYFTDIEPSSISFGGGDQIFGPVHTNDYLKIYSSGATFHDEAKTAKTVQGASYGTFKKGYVQNASVIPMPKTADLTKLQTQAAAGGTAITSTTSGGMGEATTRVEFVAIDLNGDLDTSDENEGFVRVYKSTDYRWLSGDLPNVSNPWRNSENCGHYHAGSVFVSAKAHGTSGSDSWTAALASSTRRCLLGGSESLNAGGAFLPNDGKGSYQAWSGAVSPLVVGRPDANYLWPISRSLNPNFKGVIYVDGHVVISGRLRGRVTLAATGDIIIGDDLTYVSDPGLGTCADLLGLFSGADVVVADNTLNAPYQATGTSTWYTFDDTKDEFIHGVVLALSNFTVEDYSSGSTTGQSCGSSAWGRGCLFLSGGVIQSQRGAVGTISGSAGTGYVKRYSYDACAAKQPPPYFPTTGHFIRGQHFPVDPTGFSVASYFADLQTT